MKPETKRIFLALLAERVVDRIPEAPENICVERRLREIRASISTGYGMSQTELRAG